MKRIGSVLFAALLLAWLPAPAQASTIMLVPPSGIVFGFPGQTVGFGYTIEADATHHVVWVGDDFVQVEITSPDGSSATTIPFNFPLIEAGDIASQPYDGFGPIGFFDVFVDPLLLPGATVTGRIYGEFSSRLSGDDINDPLALAGDEAQLFDIQFTVQVVESVPEPGAAVLVGSGLLGLWAVRRRRAR